MGTESLAAAAGAVALVGLIVGIGVWASKKRKQIAASWRDFAQAHGFDHAEGSRRVKGTVEGGRSFEMFQDVARYATGHARRRQANQVPGLIVKVGLDDVPDGLMAEKKPLLMTGGVATGDPAFDKKVHVICPDAAAAKQWLSNPARREAVLDAAIRLGAAVIGKSDVFEEPMLFRRFHNGYKPRVDWFEARLQEFVEAARKIDES